MASASRHRAPLTLRLIVRVNEILSSRGLTREDFRGVMNMYLPAERRIKSNHSGAVKLNRWLNPTGNDWCEPRAEIALAMQLAADKLDKLEKNS